jgi:hypothetical protein
VSRSNTVKISQNGANERKLNFVNIMVRLRILNILKSDLQCKLRIKYIKIFMPAFAGCSKRGET